MAPRMVDMAVKNTGAVPNFFTVSLMVLVSVLDQFYSVSIRNRDDYGLRRAAEVFV